ncbi:hypothetical protein [Vibrio alginolyticus]|uniref:hypothetical protein n=1 Tax=Vibrio alginolyticus TaxID=663 RepID=UPI001BD20683|nr:hypothetical protein [Vibrio alginolyticus]MBS9853043.1 hypothetical protein [Vibrio alginolyticus]
MAIQDSNAERRNLIMISMSLIVFFYSGGAFTDETVRLQVVNVHFSRPLVLVVIVWAVFFWSLYRYWLIHNGAFSSKFMAEIRQMKNDRVIVKYIERKQGIKLIEYPQTDGYIIDTIVFETGVLVPEISIARNVTWSNDRSMQSYSLNKDLGFDRFIRLNSARGLLAQVSLLLKCAFSKKSFSEYLAPYLLAFLAILGPISEKLL